jgi:hypothetical protein
MKSTDIDTLRKLDGVGLVNDSRIPGKPASHKVTFGPFNRYAVYAVHTRFDAVCWMVEDAETPDEPCGLPASIIRQEDTLAEAIEGLDTN